MTNANKNPCNWSAVRQEIAKWEKPAQLALVKDLYETAGANRDFVNARCSAGQSGGEVLEKYRARIVEQFFPARGFGKLKLGEARKAIREYRKATGNIPIMVVVEDMRTGRVLVRVASQTADIGFTSKTLRRIGTVHGVIAFVFNTAVLALGINLVAGLF